MWSWRKNSIVREIKRRDIRLLLHSTHTFKNLPHILETGKLETAGALLQNLGHEKAARYLHDPNRYEQFQVGLDYLNCSVTVPNYELLYHRSKNNWKSEWVHLALNLNLLEHPSALFSPLSAAQNRGYHVVSGLVGFQKLFESKIESYNRTGLRDDEPTHPQAEVLIHGSLPIESIQSIHVPDSITALEIQRTIEFYSRKIPVNISPHLFVWPKRLLSPK